jgi:hypothetical protein
MSDSMPENVCDKSQRLLTTISDGVFGEKLDGPFSVLRRAIAEVEQSWSVIGRVTKN